MPRSLSRSLAALVLAAASVAWMASPAVASEGSTTTVSANTATGAAAASTTPLPASSDNQKINVVSQSTWVTPGVTPYFEVDLRFSGIDSATTRVQVSVCPRLLARLDFDASLAGQEHAFCGYQATPVALSSLADTASGASRIVIPLSGAESQATLPKGALPAFSPSTENDGTYPVVVSLVDANGATIGQSITTYMVSTPSVSGLPKLTVTWVLPVETAGSDPSVPLGAEAAASLESEVAALAAHPQKLTLAVDPSTLTRLAAAGSSGAHAVAQLRSLVAKGDQLLPEPYVPIDVAGMTAGGQGADVSLQYAAGAAVLRQVLGRSPETQAWAFTESPLQPALLDQARQQGATELAMPARNLSPVPVGKTSFAETTKLSGYPGVQAVAGSDTELALHFTNSGDQVLQAEQFLAELAVIDLETPSERRGLAVVVPPNWRPSAAFVSTVLAGLAGNPLLQEETLQQFFPQVPIGQNNGSDLSLSLLPAPPATPVTGGTEIDHARSLIASLSSTVEVPPAEIADLNNEILLAESSALAPGERKVLLDGIATLVSQSVGKVKLAPQLSVTLTSTSADVPVTVLNTGTLPVKVQLVLSSQKLSFRPFTLPAGSCVTEAHTTELCSLTVPVGATLLKVPVETRTSGVFALDLSLQSGDGAYPIGQARYTVRSTAVSDVAVVLMVGAAILLGVWWVRDRRHGRRARQLVDPPSDESTEEEMSEVPDAPGGQVGPPQVVGQAPTTVPAVAVPELAKRWSPAPPTRFRNRSKPPERQPDRTDTAGAPDAPDTLNISDTPGASGPTGAPGPSDQAPDTETPAGPVPTPSGRDPASVPTEGHGGPLHSGLWVDDDPVVAEFFSTPPPFFIPAGHRNDEEQVPSKKQSKIPKAPGRTGTSR